MGNLENYAINFIVGSQIELLSDCSNFFYCSVLFDILFLFQMICKWLFICPIRVASYDFQNHGYNKNGRRNRIRF